MHENNRVIFCVITRDQAENVPLAISQVLDFAWIYSVTLYHARACLYLPRA